MYHYNDVKMSSMASQITTLTIVYSTVNSGTEHESSESLAFVRGNLPVTGEFPAQKVSNSEHVSIWWRHHVETTPLWFYKSIWNVWFKIVKLVTTY